MFACVWEKNKKEEFQKKNPSKSHIYNLNRYCMINSIVQNSSITNEITNPRLEYILDFFDFYQPAHAYCYSQ